MICDAAVDEDAVDERREASNGFVWAGFPKFGRRPPRGRGRLPSVFLLTVFEPTGSPIGGVIRGATSKGACWKLTRAAKYLVLEAEGWLKGDCF